MKGKSFVLCGCVWQECRGEGGVPAGVHARGERPQRHSGGAPQDEDGHQGSGGQPGHRQRGEEPLGALTTLPQEPGPALGFCLVKGTFSWAVACLGVR